MDNTILNIFMFQNVIIYVTIIFFSLSYYIYLQLISIFKILKTRQLLKNSLKIKDDGEIQGKTINNIFSILLKEVKTKEKNI